VFERCACVCDACAMCEMRAVCVCDACGVVCVCVCVRVCVCVMCVRERPVKCESFLNMPRSVHR